MAGGQGTRLRPLTCSVPKPLAKLCGRPVVHYILDLLDEHGFDEAIFTLGYKAEQIEQLFESGCYKNINLKFSHEDFPLGTAGCVKHAATDVKEDLLVISGDALCDFDLTAALEYHCKSNAAATIITKAVTDPREYGLVNFDETGKVTGFSEKPSYLSCIGDQANTGVYLLSPSVMALIPNNKQCDFARDVFPQMLGNNQSIYAYEETGYWCDIGDFSTYAKSQFDILSGRVKCNIDESLKHRNNYIGKNTTIGQNTVIESCIIGENVSIGNRVKLQNSIILDSVFISDGATVNEAIICNGTKLLHSASVYEGSVIGEGCLIGREAIISGDVKVWNKKTIPPGANITSDIKYGSNIGVELTDKNSGGNARIIAGETNADITPEFCSRLGAALSVVTSTRRIAISSESNNASIAMKHAIMSGASGGGGEVFDLGTSSLPQLIYTAELLGCGVVARIKCGIFAGIEIFGKSGLPLTRMEERRLEAALLRAEYKNADWNSFGAIRKHTECDDLYTAMLRQYANFNSNYRIKIDCNNTATTRNIAPVFESISSCSGEILVVTLTEGGCAAEIYTGSNIKIGHDKLILLAAASLMKKGHDVALPNDFASSADFLAASYGRKILRYFLCSNDSGDEFARKLAVKQIFLRDGAVLALNVLEHLAENGIRIEDAIKTIPHFASERREVSITCPPQRIIAQLCNATSGGVGKGEGVLIGNNLENVIIRSAKKGKSLFLFAESLSSETASELCDNAEELIKKLNKEL